MSKTCAGTGRRPAGPLAWIERHPHLPILVLFAILSVGLTYPLIAEFTTALPGSGADGPFLAWNLWWVKFSLLDLHASPLYSDYIFYPIGINLAAFTLTTLNGVVSIPLQLAWGLVPTANLIALAAAVAAAFGAYLLALDLLSSREPEARAAALCAGLLYGFASYRLAYLNFGQFNLNSNEWMPYYVLYLRRCLRPAAGVPRDGIIAGIFLVLTGWSESTFTAFLALLTALYLCYRLIADRRMLFRRASLANLAALGIVGAGGLAPLLAGLGGDLARYGDFLLTGSGAAEQLSADLLSFLIPPQFSTLLGGLSRGLDFESMNLAFAGYVALALALIGGLSRRLAAEFRFWAFTALLMAILMLGPLLHVANRVIPLPFTLPFGWLQSVPLLRANRLPYRYDHLLMLAVSLLAAGGGYLLLKKTKSRALFAVLPLLLVAEHLGIPALVMPVSIPAAYQQVAAEPGDFTILDLPLYWRSSLYIQGRIDFYSQLFQAVHEKRLLNGNTSRYPPFKFQYFNELPVIHSLIRLEAGEPVDAARQAEDVAAAPEVARFFNIRYLAAQPGTAAQSVVDYASRVFSAGPVAADGVLLFRLPAPPAGPLTIDPAQPIARLYFDDGWGRPQEAAGGSVRWATTADALLRVPVERGDYQMCAFYAGAREGQALGVRVNGAPAGSLTLSTRAERYCLALPAGAVGDGLASIEFRSQPVALGDSTFSEDRVIGQTGVRAPVDIAVTSGGFWAGKFASITVGGRETYTTARGYTLAAVDAKTGRVLGTQTFDTFKNEQASSSLAGFVAGLPEGTIVAGAVADDASRHLTVDAVEALRELGVSADLRGRLRSGHAFIGIKGAAPGSAVEDTNLDFPANVSAGKNVAAASVTFALGRVEFEPVEK